MQTQNAINNRYLLLDKLGSGGMGVVYKALDRLSGEHVALKQVNISTPNLDFISKALTDNRDQLRLSLAHEFSILATLRHPNILSVLDFGFDAKARPYYTMTLLEGAKNFKDYALEQDEDHKLNLVLQILRALHYLHRRGVLHRDLKPDNVLVTPEGQVKVMDFGLAAEEEKISQSVNGGNLVGTLRYMAPELLSGKKVSVAYDLYALGMMAYEILLETYPYTYDTFNQLMLQILSRPIDCSGLPPKLEAWLTHLLAKDPAERLASAYDALLELYAAQDIAVPPETEAIREGFLQASVFVGRETEMQRLSEALEKLDTESAFFLIGGESGVGKSRLLNELRVRALVNGCLVLRGSGVSGGGLPFQLWRGILRHMVLQVDLDNFQLGVLKDIVPDMDHLLGREIAKAPMLDGQAYQQRLVFTIVDVFKQLQKPILLILDDLQWASESLLPLQQMLKVSDQLKNIMIVGAYRDDEYPNLPNELASMASLHLTRLGNDAIQKLCQFMFGERVLDSKLSTLIERESEGNTFVMIEMIRAIAQDSTHLQLIDPSRLPENVLTQGIRQLFSQRLAQMPAESLALLQTAAVSGRQIDEPLLRLIYPDKDVTNWLYLAQALVILGVQDNQWHFIHDKLRETVLADLSEDLRRKQHRTVAEALESLYPNDASYHEILFEHWQQVGELDKIYLYLMPIAEQMIMVKGAYATASKLLHDTLARMKAADVRCVNLWNWLAVVEVRQGNFSASKQQAQQAQQLAATHGDRKLLAWSLHNLGNVSLYQGDYGEARNLYEQSLAMRQELDDQKGISDSLNNLGAVALYQGDFTQAHDLYQRCLTIKQALGDQQGIALSLTNLGLVATHQGDYDGASNLYQQSLAILQILGDQPTKATTLNNLGLVAYKQGDYVRASDHYQQSLAISQDLGNSYGIAAMLNNIGRAVQKQGQPADHWFHQSLALAQQTKAMALILLSVIGFAEYFIQKGQQERAAQLATLAQHHTAQDGNVRNYLAEIWPVLEAALAAEKLTAAQEQGKSLKLEMVVEELLAEFKGAES